MRTCTRDGCEAELVGRSTKRYCSKRCAERSQPPCDIDGCDNPRRAHGFCSTHYNQLTNHLTNPIRNGDPERKRLADLAHTHVRRSRLKGGETIHRHVIAERDGWRCWLCDEAIDPEVAWPDVMCASLDHVVPLSRGGAHVAANVRIAHFVCNARRGARAPAHSE